MIKVPAEVILIILKFMEDDTDRTKTFISICKTNSYYYENTRKSPLFFPFLKYTCRNTTIWGDVWDDLLDEEEVDKNNHIKTVCDDDVNHIQRIICKGNSESYSHLSKFKKVKTLEVYDSNIKPFDLLRLDNLEELRFVGTDFDSYNFLSKFKKLKYVQFNLRECDVKTKYGWHKDKKYRKMEILKQFNKKIITHFIYLFVNSLNRSQTIFPI